MVFKSLALFKARKDPALASELARELFVDGAVERATLPVTIAKFWMTIALCVLTLISGVIIYGAVTLHGSLTLLALPFLGLGYVIIRVWRGVEAGKARVLAFAQAQSSAGFEAIRAKLSDPDEI